ncbi:hypothetical protein GWI33_010765 [Rhynchophorus ferrugineus]|uniref:Uncharacterized protein n=1 Tax=Rhynchophorus ferrugineus TaxID=354439 RepID=A0A834IRW4_RHYFE|nr:hypothetical protein GWI33_010765 [Rhynchophorus ferrugineus]
MEMDSPEIISKMCSEIVEEKIEKLHEIATLSNIGDDANQKSNKDNNVEVLDETKIGECLTKMEETEDPKNKVEAKKPKEKGQVSDSTPCCTNQTKRKIIRNQSDIFSLKDAPTTLQTSIFSVNGSPSRRVFRKQEPAGHVFQRSEDKSESGAASRRNRITRENYNDEKRPSSSYRNPLTGTGLSSNDEYKSKGLKRKDGNPLLGLGYDSEASSASSQHRIPPGGYSHKLW